MYGKNVWVSDAVHLELERMKTLLIRERATDPTEEFVKTPSFSDVIALALVALADHCVGLERKQP